MTANSEPRRAVPTYTAGDAPARVSGYAIDSAIVFVGSFVVLSVLGLVHGPVAEISSSGELSDRVDIDGALFAIDTAIVVLASGAYFVMSWIRRGATIGQRIVGLRVIAIDQAAGPTVWAAMIRYLALGAPLWVIAGFVSGNARMVVWGLALLWYVVLLASVISGSSTSGIHDRMARTIVVREVALVDLGSAQPEMSRVTG